MKRYLKYGVLLLLFVVPNVFATPANDTFIDDNLYKCVIDAYNKEKTSKVDYTYSILPEELISIKTLDCTNYKGMIDNLTGLNKMTGLTSLNLSGNEFLGGSLSITNTTTGTLKSTIKLPSSLSITDKTYTVDNPKILKIESGVVVALENGSTTVTMTGKVSGTEIKEKYLVSINNDNLKKSSNAKLASLYLSKGDFKFDSDNYDYTVIVASSLETVKVNATLLDKTASFETGFGPRDVKLNYGTNKVEVKVKAEDGSVKVYTLNIIRSEGSDENIRLINIELSVGKIDFDPDVYIYSFTVESTVNELEVVGVAESTLSTVEVSDTKLKVGENSIVITVTSESGNKKAYQLLVTREDYDSEYNYLKGLTINNYDISFGRNKYTYDLTIGYEKTLSILPVLEHSTSSYIIKGNKDLKNGSKINIIVSDSEGSKRTYTINITRKDFLEQITYKEIILLLEFLIIIILILVLIFRNNKPKRPKSRPVQKKFIANNMNAGKVCKSCGSVNNTNAKNCYVCGKPI